MFIALVFRPKHTCKHMSVPTLWEDRFHTSALLAVFSTLILSCRCSCYHSRCSYCCCFFFTIYIYTWAHTQSPTNFNIKRAFIVKEKLAMVSLMCLRSTALPVTTPKLEAVHPANVFFFFLCVYLVSYSNYGPITDSQNQAGESRRGLFFLSRAQPCCRTSAERFAY